MSIKGYLPLKMKNHLEFTVNEHDLWNASSMFEYSFTVSYEKITLLINAFSITYTYSEPPIDTFQA